ncbi:hypothetical protein [Streptomyces sp. NPDC001970]
MIRDDSAQDGDDLAEAAAKAGAKGIVIVMPEGFPAWTRWKPTGTRTAIPVVRLDAADGAELLQYAKKPGPPWTFPGRSRARTCTTSRQSGTSRSRRT